MRILGYITGAMFTLLLILGIMIATKTGVAIVNDGDRGIMKTGTKYDMQAVQPGYHIFVPIYQTMDIKTIRPILINYSKSESGKQDTELLQYETPLKGLDKKGIPVGLALSIEVRPNAENLPLMYREDGDFENSFYKKVLQVNREAVQSTISKFSVDTIMDHRAEVEKTLTDLLKSSYSKNPYFTLVGINLKDILVPEKITQKMLEVQVAKQTALASLELVKKAENEAQAVIAKAKGEAEAVKIKADSEAYANKTVSKSVTDKLLKLESIKKWNGVTPTTVGNEKSSFIFSVK